MKKTILVLIVIISLFSCDKKKEIDKVAIVKEYLKQHYGQLMADAVLSVTDGDIPYNDTLFIFYANYSNAVREFNSWIETNYCAETQTAAIDDEYQKQKQRVDKLIPAKDKWISLYLQPLQMFSHIGTYVDMDVDKCKIYKVELRGLTYIGLLIEGDEIFTDTQAILNRINSMYHN